jgi:(p)ppGpp synthase/HD superfamily hydrolase
MKSQIQLERAIRLAMIAHAGQVDKAGRPYILHPLKVMELLNTDDYELMAIAVLHDVVEDTEYTLDDLMNDGINIRVINGVKALTKVKGQSYDEYKTQVKANLDAVKVKMADLTHNSNISRISNPTQKDFDRVTKYFKFYDELENFLNG